jgi:hypothetical protein
MILTAAAAIADVAIKDLLSIKLCKKGPYPKTSLK